VVLRKDLSIETPELDVRTPLERPSAAAAGYHATMGVAPDLREAARQSVARMIEYLMKTYGLTRQYAYMLCSVQGDLKISEIVDAPNWIPIAEYATQWGTRDNISGTSFHPEDQLRWFDLKKAE
jgi:acetamidase/formamidase